MNTIAFAVCAVAAVVLQGCGGGGASTPAPVPSPSTPSPTPSPTPPKPTPAPTKPTPDPHAGCRDAACCKAKALSSADNVVCDNFYDLDTGVAVSMISLNVWAGTGSGSTGMDKAVFNVEPPTDIIDGAEQAITISTSEKSAWFYPAASKYGIVYGLGQESVFWKFFGTCPTASGDILCAQCEDGFKCPIKSAPAVTRRTLGSMTFADFKEKKNAIVKQTGTAACKLSDKHAYNEFDSNGLSSTDLGGVFEVRSGGAAAQAKAPSDATVCAFLAKANPKRTQPWPVYVYDAQSTTSSLVVDRYLACGKEAEMVV